MRNPEERVGEDAIGLSGGDEVSGNMKSIDESAGNSLNKGSFCVSFACIGFIRSHFILLTLPY